jgi:hypothetical protein
VQRSSGQVPAEEPQPQGRQARAGLPPSDNDNRRVLAVLRFPGA